MAADPIKFVLSRFEFTDRIVPTRRITRDMFDGELLHYNRAQNQIVDILNTSYTKEINELSAKLAPKTSYENAIKRVPNETLREKMFHKYLSEYHVISKLKLILVVSRSNKMTYSGWEVNPYDKAKALL